MEYFWLECQNVSTSNMLLPIYLLFIFHSNWFNFQSVLRLWKNVLDLWLQLWTLRWNKISCRRGSVTITSGYALKAYQSIQSLSSLHSYFRLYVENFVYFFLNTFSIIFLFHIEDSYCSREEVFFLKQCLLQFAYLPFI